MGLSVTTFDLAQAVAMEDEDPADVALLRGELDRLSNFLVRQGLPPHREPEEPPDHDSFRGELDGFPYSCLHYLRRAYAHQRRGLKVTPFAVKNPLEDPVLAQEYASRAVDSHLIHFSDSAGYYVPIDFERPLAAPTEDELPGNCVGSSYGLLRELIDVAPVLGIALVDGDLPDAGAEELADFEADDAHPFGRERMVWFTLYEAARRSIQFSTAIRFG